MAGEKQRNQRGFFADGRVEPFDRLFPSGNLSDGLFDIDATFGNEFFEKFGFRFGQLAEKIENGCRIGYRSSIAISCNSFFLIVFINRPPPHKFLQ